ncbi:hypothetical protein TIFTF001_051088 [Ficus carica]|uniref:Uncharacterized protein n=1 Tax=Ficus carica TaxID=3494 RepID=A0AA87ZAQ3_FICCA|nr:hypothetical protein TIFTF001_051088 [Ficus carica]
MLWPSRTPSTGWFTPVLGLVTVDKNTTTRSPGGWVGGSRWVAKKRQRAVSSRSGWCATVPAWFISFVSKPHDAAGDLDCLASLFLISIFFGLRWIKE